MHVNSTGKIMPAHYAMPYFIKPNGKSKFNYRDSSNPFLNKSKTLLDQLMHFLLLYVKVVLKQGKREMKIKKSI